MVENGGLPEIAPPCTTLLPPEPLLKSATVSHSTWYDVIGLPPSELGGSKNTSSSVPETTYSFTPSGAPGTRLGITEIGEDD